MEHSKHPPYRNVIVQQTGRRIVERTVSYVKTGVASSLRQNSARSCHSPSLREMDARRWLMLFTSLCVDLDRGQTVVFLFTGSVDDQHSGELRPI